ncbi:MAG: signal recognition particle-docking protein FtsY [Deltaproteobacteria bacterium CG11_big_fil_rev_8_21_14_0_20_45_16]|nr:MAG: signal recognition particle-docking protein FtsY [Deltaproteobacteria bacterium CG11_big_fil_rev_8_21_14_0_20_45_16]
MDTSDFIALGLVVGIAFAVGMAIFAYRKFGLRKEDLLAPSPDSEDVESLAKEALEPQPPVLLETKQPTKISRAIASWIPLLKSKSKDSQKWEEVLIMSDMGPTLASELLQDLHSANEDPDQFFKSRLKNILSSGEAPKEVWKNHKPWVCFLVGVNGVGKTTTAVKLAYFFKKQSLSVGMIGADTFRKAAIEQLERQCTKNEVDFFSYKVSDEKSEGADPSAVIFDGLKQFVRKDIIIVDTSGRLHTKKNLMEELKKMKRVGDKALSGAPHDIWLVLDASLGLNAINQAEVFNEAVDLTGMILTKLDGLSKGGVIFQLYRKFRKPIWFVGKGESEKDLEIFNADHFVEELFDLGA